MLKFGKRRGKVFSSLIRSIARKLNREFNRASQQNHLDANSIAKKITINYANPYWFAVWH
jgi:hypothetical protein